MTARTIGLLMVCAVGGCSGVDHGASNPFASIDSVLTVAGRRVPPAVLNRYVAENVGFTSHGGEMRCAYTPLGVERDRVFVNTLCLELVDAGDSLATGAGRGGPIALRAVVEANTVRVTSHEVPDDGDRYRRSVRRIFPEPIADRILAGEGDTSRVGRTAMLEAYLRGEAASRLGLRP